MLRRLLRALPFTLALTALLLAAPADAHGPKWRRHYSHYHGGHGRGDIYYAPRYVVRPVYRYPVYYHGYGPEAFFCGPCSHHFASYDDLSYHVHHRHRIAVVELPSVIIHGPIGAGVGWFFDF
jgi:hypothetical protein